MGALFNFEGGLGEMAQLTSEEHREFTPEVNSEKRLFAGLMGLGCESARYQCVLKFK
jgi:hypothetical protein